MSTLPLSPNYPVKPSRIDTFQHFWDAFGNSETEASAHWVVRLCQERGGDSWAPFRGEEIRALYNARFPSSYFSFNKLIIDGFVKEDGDTYTVTHEFVARCYKASPATETATGGTPNAEN